MCIPAFRDVTWTEFDSSAVNGETHMTAVESYMVEFVMEFQVEFNSGELVTVCCIWEDSSFPLALFRLDPLLVPAVLPNYPVTEPIYPRRHENGVLQPAPRISVSITNFVSYSITSDPQSGHI